MYRTNIESLMMESHLFFAKFHATDFFSFVSIEFQVTRKAISIVPVPIQIIIDKHNWNFSHVLSINHFSFSVWTSSLIFLRKLKQCVRIEAICWFYLFYDEAFVCRCRPYCNKYNVTSSSAFGLMVQLSPTRLESTRFGPLQML